MKIKFLGVGDAYDENNGNTSILVQCEKNILLDCGFSVPFVLWQLNLDKDYLDAIYISHAHGDHILGVPSVLSRFNNLKRNKSIDIIGSVDAIINLKKIISIVKPGLLINPLFSINFIEIDENSIFQIDQVLFKFERTKHTTTNFAVKITNQGKCLCYSGDGKPTKKTKHFYMGVDALCHEAFSTSNEHIDHTYGTLLNDIFDLRINKLFLVHTGKEERAKIKQDINLYLSENVNSKIVVPEKGEEFDI